MDARPAVGDGVLSQVRAGPLRHVRSTLLCSSVTEIRKHGLFDAYVNGLPRAAVDVLVHGVAATWLPVEIAEAHYAACDRLGINADEAIRFGATSADRVQHSFLKTLLLVARGAGATPLLAFARCPRLWGRHFEGGNVTVTRAGQKDVTVDIRDFSLARSSFFRHAFRGGNEAALRLFASTVVVRELGSSPTSLLLRMSWV